MLRALWRLISGLILLILVVVIAFQNRRPIHIYVLWWILPHVPLAVVVLLAILVGTVLGMFAAVWGILQKRRRTSRPTVPDTSAENLPDRGDTVPQTHGAPPPTDPEEPTKSL